MPDRRRHRGPHPADGDLFAPAAVPTLRRAVAELSWLLSRGYSTVAALKLVGDRHGLRERQRRAVARSACSDDALADRRARRLPLDAIADADVAIDGLNCIITVEAAMSGAVVLVGRDGCARDLASIHGSYRKVEETRAAVIALGERLARAEVATATWVLDRPVSNSGRLGALIAALAEERGWPWRVELENSPDRAITAASGAAPGRVVASADAWVLDHAGPWIDLPRAVIAERLPEAWVLDLGATPAPITAPG